VSDQPSGYGSRLLDFCVAILLGAMALYGAVQVVKVIWMPLCIGAFVIVAVAAIVWYLGVHSRRF
jgi:hypothetical protein